MDSVLLYPMTAAWPQRVELVENSCLPTSTCEGQMSSFRCPANLAGNGAGFHLVQSTARLRDIHMSR